MQASPYEQVIIEEKGHYPAYVKLITNKLDNERIVGFHVLAPNAGEITQGFSLGMK
jgi:thioredoxin reductase (NADPH)